MTQTPPAPDNSAARLKRLERALEAERAARMRAETESRAKSELLATISHKARTPMGEIVAMAERLLGTKLDERQRRYGETLAQSVRVLKALLSEIPDFSKLEAGRLKIETVPFDFSELMRSVGRTVKIRAREKKLATSLELADGFPAQLLGDPVCIGRIFDTLIDNAVKFTEQGSIRILAGYGRDGDEVVLRFEVHDTGIGLDSRRIEQLFAPHQQAGGPVAVNNGGAGLSLSIARQLARSMGGDLGCESSPEQGSLFWFTIRVREAAEVSPEPVAAPNPVAAKSSAPAPNPVAAKRLVPAPGLTAAPIARPGPVKAPLGPLSGHVLIVEDNNINQMLIVAYLEQFGLTYETVVNGQEAVNSVQENQFDVVLMDIMMPVMDGLEATRRIRALNKPAARVPIIALTAHAMKGDRETYLSAGMDGYVSKPVSAADLFSALCEHIGIEPQAVGSKV